MVRRRRHLRQVRVEVVARQVAEPQVRIHLPEEHLQRRRFEAAALGHRLHRSVMVIVDQHVADIEDDCPWGHGSTAQQGTEEHHAETHRADDRQDEGPVEERAIGSRTPAARQNDRAAPRVGANGAVWSYWALNFVYHPNRLLSTDDFPPSLSRLPLLGSYFAERACFGYS